MTREGPTEKVPMKQKVGGKMISLGRSWGMGGDGVTCLSPFDRAVTLLPSLSTCPNRLAPGPSTVHANRQVILGQKQTLTPLDYVSSDLDCTMG